MQQKSILAVILSLSLMACEPELPAPTSPNLVPLPTLFTLLTSPNSLISPTSPKAGTTTFMLFMDDWGSTKRKREQGIKLNGAILITDKKVIQRFERLFLDNASYTEGPMPEYELHLLESSGQFVKSFSFTSWCGGFAKYQDLIRAELQPLMRRLDTKPTHYLYDIKVPVTVDPETVKKSFAASPLDSFVSGYTGHFFSLTYLYQKTSKWPPASMRPYPSDAYKKKERGDYADDKQKYEKTREHLTTNEENLIFFEEMRKSGERYQKEREAYTDDERKHEEIHKQLTKDEANLIAEEIRKIAPLNGTAFSGTHLSPWTRQGEKAHTSELTLYFPIGTDLSKVKELIIAKGGKIKEENKPTHWSVQLVDTSDKLDVVKAKLAKYPFVLDVYESPSYR